MFKKLPINKWAGLAIVIYIIIAIFMNIFPECAPSWFFGIGF